MIKDIWHLYLIRCKNNSLYTGITTDVGRRFKMHCNGEGAKYLRGKGPLTLEFNVKVGSKSEALKLEYRIKRLPKNKKEMIIKEGISNILTSS